MTAAPSPLTANARRILEARYLRRDAQGKVIETPEELFARVAKAVAQAELGYGHASQVAQWEETFATLLSSLDFLPNSPALMNAGLPIGQLSACFVLPLEDTMEGIFETLKQAALVQRTGGGTGFSFSHLRPKGDRVHSTGGEASGPVSFMKIFDSATEHIKQGGRRRGANMGILRVDHPDILDFIQAKLDQTTLKNFNISVGVTDAFLHAVRNQAEYELIHPTTRQVVRRLSARKVFEAIVQAAWQTGDPGLIFLDAINRTNPTPALGSFEATNPCGEVPLLPNESCNLGSINLAHCVRGAPTKPAIDWEKVERLVPVALRFLDNLLDVNRYPTPAIAQMSLGTRKIGLGVMGFAELLIRLGIPYDSQEAIALGSQLMQVIAQVAERASMQLAEERGVFPHWPHSVYASRNQKRRNATCTAIAPTGTISLLAGTTPSIEPLFAIVSRRIHSLGGEPLYEIAPLLIEACHVHHIDPEQLLSQVRRTRRLRDIPGLPESMTRVFVTALEIHPEQHLLMQAAFQRHVENSVSKTINLPEEAPPSEVEWAFWRAWELNLKGITIFRYGSKGDQVLEWPDTREDLAIPTTQCHPC
ncbi:MAG: adenosylcobalamin-dependent ribonucleoside-diphosphate reductase [Nitrospirae bacterium]|nr:MAG: adenosylcobalamin-dependent ribonucleoside-diphosphate reductase [Nitrospirota bacterium]